MQFPRRTIVNDDVRNGRACAFLESCIGVNRQFFMPVRGKPCYNRLITILFLPLNRSSFTELVVSLLSSRDSFHRLLTLSNTHRLKNITLTLTLPTDIKVQLNLVILFYLSDYEILRNKKRKKKQVSIFENTGPRVFKFIIRYLEILRDENYLEEFNVGERKK